MIVISKLICIFTAHPSERAPIRILHSVPKGGGMGENHAARRPAAVQSPFEGMKMGEPRNRRVNEAAKIFF